MKGQSIVAETTAISDDGRNGALSVIQSSLSLFLSSVTNQAVL